MNDYCILKIPPFGNVHLLCSECCRCIALDMTDSAGKWTLFLRGSREMPAALASLSLTARRSSLTFFFQENAPNYVAVSVAFSLSLDPSLHPPHYSDNSEHRSATEQDKDEHFTH